MVKSEAIAADRARRDNKHGKKLKKPWHSRTEIHAFAECAKSKKHSIFKERLHFTQFVNFGVFEAILQIFKSK